MSTSKRILLVDDDHDHLLLCSLILRRNGYISMGLPGCEKVEDILEVLNSFKPELIFMDQDMPGICGMDLILLLKSHVEYRHIPIIYFSGRDDIAELAKKAGADDHFNKPFESDRFLEITRKHTRF